jgi:hypothetical protein
MSTPVFVASETKLTRKRMLRKPCAVRSTYSRRSANRRPPNPESVVDVPAGILAAATFVALYRFQAKLTVLFVVLGCGLLGAAFT